MSTKQDYLKWKGNEMFQNFMSRKCDINYKYWRKTESTTELKNNLLVLDDGL